jgi:hypothetical protein
VDKYLWEEVQVEALNTVIYELSNKICKPEAALERLGQVMDRIVSRMNTVVDTDSEFWEDVKMQASQMLVNHYAKKGSKLAKKFQVNIDLYNLFKGR